MTVPLQRVLRWCGLTISCVTAAMSGLATAFNVYAIALKETFNYTQTEVEMVATGGLAGMGMACIQPIVTEKFGVQWTYMIILFMAPLSTSLIYVGTIFKEIVKSWPILIALCLFFANMASNMLQFHIVQISVSLFPEKVVGKVVGFYVALIGMGKIFFGGLYEIFFDGDFGGFFLCIGVLWSVEVLLCSVLHRPAPVKEEQTLILVDKTSGGTSGQTPRATTKTSSLIKAMIKSPYFHIIYWSSVIFYGCFFTCLNNLTSIGRSAGMENPIQLVYIMSVAMVISRISFGAVYDYFSSDVCGFGLLISCYIFFLLSMVVASAWFGTTSVYPITVLVGLSVAGGHSLPWTMLAVHFGRQLYSYIVGSFFLWLSLSVCLFQVLVGYTYDSNVTEVSTDGLSCYGKHCFLQSFIAMMVATIVIGVIQLVYLIAVIRLKQTD